MQVEVATAAAHVEHGGQSFHFCSDRCRERFEADPAHYNERAADRPHAHA